MQPANLAFAASPLPPLRPQLTARLGALCNLVRTKRRQRNTTRSTVTASTRPPRSVAVVEVLTCDGFAYILVKIGCGTDLHGQDATVAAIRACRDAIEFNSLPGLGRLLPGGDYGQMTVHVRLGVPRPFMDDVDERRVREQFPYGEVVVEVVEGGLCCGTGVVLPELGDAPDDDRAVIVVAAVSVIC